MNNDNLPIVLHHYLRELENQVNLKPFSLNAFKRQVTPPVQLPHLPAETLTQAGPDDYEMSFNLQPISADDDYEVKVLYTGLVSTFNPIIHLIAGLWVHGSLATKDYTPYSDVDLFLVLKEHALSDAQLLNKVQAAVQKSIKHILLFDPLQHHGLMIGVDIILKTWPSSYLPLPVLQHARPLWEPAGSYKIHSISNPDTDAILFHNLIERILDTEIPNTLFQVKSQLSRLMLLPAAYYQAIGLPMYKRESLALFKEDFKDFWRPLEEATYIRANWRKTHRPLWKLLLVISSPWIASRIYRPFERNNPKLLFYNDWGAFSRDIKRLAIHMDEKVKAHHL